MPEKPSQPIQRHNVTDLVLSKLRSYDQLNPDINPGENPAQKRKEAFHHELEQVINQSRVVEYTDGYSGSVDIVQLLDNKGEKRPIIIKVILPWMQSKVDAIEKAHKLHVALLGPEFVEDMTRVTITNNNILKHIRYDSKYKDINSLEAFVQDLRGLDKKQGLFQYLLDNRQADIPQHLKEKIRLFFERLLDAYQKGYSFDLDVFLVSRMPSANKNPNILVDDEGVTFIDSGSIYSHDENPDWNAEFYDLKRAIQLFTGKITPNQICEDNYEKRSAAIAKITTESLNNEITQLKADLQTIKK